jgi:hypothetical protein
MTLRNQYIGRGFVPVPDKPGQLRYDQEGYIKNLKMEAEKRKQVMQQIIKTRNIEAGEKDSNRQPLYGGTKT